MAILSNTCIQERLSNGSLKVEPPGIQGPASIDLHLDFDAGFKHLNKNNSVHFFKQAKERVLVLPPNSFGLALTKQKVSIPNELLANVEGRSSWGRLGLAVHITAGFIDPGFKGQIVLELHNCSNEHVHIPEDAAICQLSFTELTSPCSKPYSSKEHSYQNQKSIIESKYSITPMNHVYPKGL